MFYEPVELLLILVSLSIRTVREQPEPPNKNPLAHPYGLQSGLVLRGECRMACLGLDRTWIDCGFVSAMNDE